MVPQRIRRLGVHGIGLAELLAVLAIIGLTAALAAPMLISYWQASTLTAGAQELQAVLNNARQLAIRQNTTVCVQRSGNQVRFRTNGCGGAVWVGTGTDANGWMSLSNGVEITNATEDVIFTHLGAASPAGTYTVRNPANTAQTQTVTVAASGRVTVP